MGATNQSWTIQDYDYLYKHYCSDGPKACANHLGVPVGLVKIKAKQLGIFFKRKATKEEIHLCKCYSTALGSALIFLMPDRSVSEIEEMVQCSKETLL